jgi:hypothetical protein
MNIAGAIKNAEIILPGNAAPEKELDPRWQAILVIEDFVREEPEAVWSFVERWGRHPSQDLRQAIATCLLERLLAHHFDILFPRVEQLAKENRLFAETVGMCWLLGQAEREENAGRMKRLVEETKAQASRG